MKQEGSQLAWQRDFNTLLDELVTDMGLKGADIVNLKRLYYLIPLGCTSQDIFERSVELEHQKEYQIQPQEIEHVSNSYLALGIRLQTDYLSS